MRSHTSEQARAPLTDYAGFVGLNQVAELPAHVMMPEEVQALFANAARYNALYAYPQAVANAFNEAPVFSVVAIDQDSMLLQAENTTNDYPRDCLTWFAAKLLPDEYIARDRIRFETDAAQGFGSGTCRITTEQCLRPDGRSADFAKKMIAVTNRPGLFLKIRNCHGGFYDDAAIFFPDKAEGVTHQAVKFGEAFVLHKEGLMLEREFLIDVQASFNLLVNTSHYARGNGLYSTHYHQPIDEHVSRPILEAQRNRLD
mgnify:CR=1 FL=1|tara:strand:- start:1076 stop:1846 length:771 start_codon:yes stop_codon:yes gene_type:complete